MHGKTHYLIYTDLMKSLLLPIFLSFAVLLFPSSATAQTLESPNYSTGTVTQVEETEVIQNGQEFFTQTVQVKRSDNGEIVVIQVGNEFQPLNRNQLLTEGKSIVIADQLLTSGEVETVLADVNRIPTVILLFLLFTVVVIAVGRWQGVQSILGMFLSLGILMNFIIPQIISGANPVIVSLIGSLIIGAVTVYLSHGFRLKSHIALASMMLSLFAVSILSYISVHTSQLVGLGSEEAYFLQFGSTSIINLQGLLLGGIMLGALGVLDDITVSQVSVVFQLRATKKNISFAELYARALSVGKDHVASLVNTLVLAYAGANLPLFLLFTINENVPKWVTLNSEVIVEEIVRTLAGSIGLVLAVPLATVLAVYFALKMDPKEIEHEDHTHHH